MVVVDVINVYKKLKGECKRNATRFISVMPRTRVNKHKVKHRMFPLLTNTFFFTVRAMEHWNKLYRGSVVSILGDTQKLSENGPGLSVMALL